MKLNGHRWTTSTNTENKRGKKVFRLGFFLYFEKEIETFLNISCQIYTNEIKSISLFQSPFVKLINEKNP